MQDKYSWLKDWVGVCVNSVIIRELTAEQAVEAIEAKIISALEQSELEGRIAVYRGYVTFANAAMRDFGPESHVKIKNIRIEAQHKIDKLESQLKNIKAKT